MSQLGQALPYHSPRNPAITQIISAYPEVKPNRCRAPRVITGQRKTTTLEAFRMEAGVTSIVAQAQQQAAVAYEKAQSPLANHPRRALLEEQEDAHLTLLGCTLTFKRQWMVLLEG